MVGPSLVMRLAPLVLAIALIVLYATDVVEEWGLLVALALFLAAWAYDTWARRAARDAAPTDET
jgi:hypothetical protein